MTLSSLQVFLNSFKREIFRINGFSVTLWMFIFLAFLLIILAILIIHYTKHNKKNSVLKSITEVEELDVPLETITIISREETLNDDEIKVNKVENESEE